MKGVVHVRPVRADAGRASGLSVPPLLRRADPSDYVARAAGLPAHPVRSEPDPVRGH